MSNGGFELFRVTRPQGYGQVVIRHLPWVVLSGMVLLASFFLPLDGFSVHICAFLWLTGYPCPSCGWTRGVVAMANGHWMTVLHDCPLAAVLYGLTALIFAWNAAALILGVNVERGRRLSMSGKQGWWLFVVACLMVLANWMYRLAMGFK